MFIVQSFKCINFRLMGEQGLVCGSVLEKSILELYLEGFVLQRDTWAHPSAV